MVARGAKLISIAILVMAACVSVAAQAAPSGPHTRHQLSDAVLPLAEIGKPFSYQLETDLGEPDPVFSVSKGQLPAGISLSDAGLIGGIPTELGSSPFTVTASNGTGNDISKEMTMLVGGSPVLTLLAAKAITSSSADLTASLDPRNLATNTWFEYWPAANPSNIAYTDMQTVAAATAPVEIAAPITGLEPATDYQFRVAAFNDAGLQGVYATPVGLKTGGLPPPTAGETFNLEPVDGTTTTKCKGDQAFRKLKQPKQVTLDCKIDTNHGTVALTASKGSSRETQTARFWGGLFRVYQQKGDNKDAVLNLAGGLRCERRKSGKSSRAPRRDRKRGGGRQLWGSGSGNYKTVGSHGAATVTGTIWLVTDRCDGSTFVKVKEGTVVVRDFTKQASVVLNAGEQYIAKAETSRLP